MHVLLDSIIKGSVLFGIILCIWNAIKLFGKHTTIPGGVIYNSEHSKVDFDKSTVTYDYLPKHEEENIKSGIGAILSGIITLIAFWVELIIAPVVEIDLHYRIICILLVGVIIALLIDTLNKVISWIVIRRINIKASQKGLVRKLTKGDHVVG